MAVAHEPGVLQDREMLRDGGLRDLGPSRQRPDGLLAVAAQSLEETAPSSIGERSEEQIVSIRHLKSITGWLLIRDITAKLWIIQALRETRRSGQCVVAGLL